MTVTRSAHSGVPGDDGANAWARCLRTSSLDTETPIRSTTTGTDSTSSTIAASAPCADGSGRSTRLLARMLPSASRTTDAIWSSTTEIPRTTDADGPPLAGPWVIVTSESSLPMEPSR